MPDLLNGEDLVNGTDGATAGRFNAYQWAWFYVVASIAGLWALGYLVFKGR